MWTNKNKRDGAPASSPSSTSSSSPPPFFPDVGPRVSYYSSHASSISPSASAASRHSHSHAQGHASVDAQLEAALMKNAQLDGREESKERDSIQAAYGAALAQLGGKQQQRGNYSNVYPRNIGTPSPNGNASRSSKKQHPLSMSYSTESLRASGGGHGSPPPSRGMQHSVSAATLPSSPLHRSSVTSTPSMHSSSSFSTLPPPSTAPHPRSHSPQRRHTQPLHRMSHSQAREVSSKLSTRVDKWTSVEELLDHSAAVIRAGGRMGTQSMAAADGAYDPVGFSTFSNGLSSNADLSLRSPNANRSTTKPKQLDRSSLSTPPHPSQLTPASDSSIAPAPATPRTQFLSRIQRKLSELEASEISIQANPSVLFAAGLDEHGRELQRKASRSSSPIRNGGSGNGSGGSNSNSTTTINAFRRGGGGSIAPLDPAEAISTSSSKSAPQQLWSQHLSLLAAARESLPDYLRSDTRKQVVQAVQGLRPQVLLDVFAPQLHILDVSMRQLTTLFEREDKTKAAMLKHFVQHSNLILDFLLHFAAASCQTLQGEDAQEHSEGHHQQHGSYANDGMAQADNSPSRRVSSMRSDSETLNLLMRPPSALKNGGGGGGSGVSSDANLHSNQSRPSTAPSLQQIAQDDERTLSDIASSIVSDSTSYLDRNSISPTATSTALSLLGSSAPAPDLSSLSSLLSALDSPDICVPFGHTPSWRVERWRVAALKSRMHEFENEMDFLRALDITYALYKLKVKEVEELEEVAKEALNGPTTGAAALEHTYNSVHGRFEKERSGLAQQLANIKLRLEPKYASMFMRHHNIIYNVEEVEAAAASAAAQDAQASSSSEGDTSGTGSPTLGRDRPEAILVMHLGLVRSASASNHSTDQSALATTHPGAIPHRLPHSTWLGTLAPNSPLLAMEDSTTPSGLDPFIASGTGTSDSSSSPSHSNSSSPSTLRARRIRALVDLENLLSLSTERYASLLLAKREISRRLETVSKWNKASEQSQEESRRVSELLQKELQSKLDNEVATRLRVEEDVRALQQKLVDKQVKIDSLYNEIGQLSYTCKQLQVTYQHAALFKPAALDGVVQTDPNVTGVECGVFDFESGIELGGGGSMMIGVDGEGLMEGGSGMEVGEGMVNEDGEQTTTPGSSSAAAGSAAASSSHHGKKKKRGASTSSAIGNMSGSTGSAPGSMPTTNRSNASTGTGTTGGARASQRKNSDGPGPRMTGHLSSSLAAPLGTLPVPPRSGRSSSSSSRNNNNNKRISMQTMATMVGRISATSSAAASRVGSASGKKKPNAPPSK